MLFEPVAFFNKYRNYIAIIVAEIAEWVGLVESKIRILVQNLERHRSIEIAHVYPKSYTRTVPYESEENENANNTAENGGEDNQSINQTEKVSDSSSTSELLNNGEQVKEVEKENNLEKNETDTSSQKSSESIPKMREERIWFIGLRFSKTESMNVDLTQDTRMFVETSKFIFFLGIFNLIWLFFSQQ